MKKVVLLAFVLFSLCVVGLLRLQIAYASPYMDISVGTAYGMITNGSYPDLVVLDVRTKSEYDGGHIYGAVWIPHTELEARIGELAGHENHEIIVYCLSGVRSATASDTLESHNFTKVYNMQGGIQAWSANYPVWIATVHNVNTTFNYDAIRAAIDANQTLDGHTILVDAGTYYEHVVVNKSISLIGGNRNTTIIDGNGTGHVIHVTANNTVITGFTIQNGEFGIYLVDSFNGSVSGNNANINYMGIRLEDSFNCSVTGNNANNNSYLGIYVYSSSNNTVVDNNANNNDWFGICLEDSSNCSVTGNNANNNDYFGIELAGSSNHVLRNNSMVGNRYNFDVLAGLLQDYIHDVDASNTVNGKPIYYLVNQHNLTVNPSTYPNLGCLVIVDSTNITVEDLTLIISNGQGLLFAYTTNSTINNVTTNNNIAGIQLQRSPNCSIIGNNVNNNWRGISLNLSSNCSVLGNNVNNNSYGIELNHSSNNTVYHNNFINSSWQVGISASYDNVWDDGYPSGGNYWSDYIDVDLYSGSNQNEAGSDGIGDTPHDIGGNNQDNYPLMGMFSDFNATSEHHVQTICSSSISNFQFNSTAISFNVSGENDTTGFCRICIPRALMNVTYKVFVNGTEVPYTLLPCSNSTHSYLYFTYNHSTQEVIIIPEFPTWTSMLLILIVLTVAIAIYKRKLLKTPIR